MFLFTLIFSFIDTLGDNIFPRIKTNNMTKMRENGYWRQYRICYPPFNWSKPNGLNSRTEKLFWAQPENHRHFKDTNASEHCGVIRVVANGKIQIPFSHLTNETHFRNTIYPPSKVLTPDRKALMVLSGHWGHFFQHFFDNIGPQLSMMRTLLGDNIHDLPVLVDTDKLFPVVPKLWERIGFPEIIQSHKYRYYSANVLFYIESTPMVHPVFFKDLRELLKIPERIPRYIIWLSRKKTNTYYAQRFILNEDKVIEMLKELYGNRLIIFDHKKYDLNQTIELFAKAKAIIGAHGGAFYNQFYAPKNCTVVEILPVTEEGKYPDQDYLDEMPSFAHMAVWSNSQLIGQKFWRYYQITDDLSFDVNVKNFRKFLKGIKELNRLKPLEGIKIVEDNEL